MPRRPVLNRVLHVDSYWSSDQGLAALLVSVALLMFVFLPLEASGLLGHGWMFLMDVWVAGVILAGASALGWRKVQRGVMVLGLALILAMLALRLVAREIPVAWTEAVSSAVSVVVFALLTALILAQVFREGPTTRYRILGAVAAYLLLGLTWAEAYRLLDVLRAGSLQGVQWHPGGYNLSTFVYFSLATLTTAGYGDIVPVSVAARALANLESLVGQLFPAVLLARLVSLSVASGKSRGE
jgi:voltage-gated potassium channel Kch